MKKPRRTSFRAASVLLEEKVRSRTVELVKRKGIIPHPPGNYSNPPEERSFYYVGSREKRSRHASRIVQHLTDDRFLP
jgi:hypothetical protein